MMLDELPPFERDTILYYRQLVPSEKMAFLEMLYHFEGQGSPIAHRISTGMALHMKPSEIMAYARQHH
jgi:hypothetical protein